MRKETDQTEYLLRRADTKRVNFKAEERTERVLADIANQHLALAQSLDISVQELRRLLSNPQEWIAFVESKRQTPSTQYDNREDINKKHKTSRKSPHSGTEFDTSGWDPGFKYGAGGRKG